MSADMYDPEFWAQCPDDEWCQEDDCHFAHPRRISCADYRARVESGNGIVQYDPPSYKDVEGFDWSTQYGIPLPGPEVTLEDLVMYLVEHGSHSNWSDTAERLRKKFYIAVRS